jgi:hypothetical protein
LAVWALNSYNIRQELADSEPTVDLVDAPYAENPNLRAQRGVFTLVKYNTDRLEREGHSVVMLDFLVYEAVSVLCRRARERKPEGDRMVAIEQLASILEGDDDEQVDDDLLVFGRVVRDRIAKNIVSTEEERQKLVRDVEAGLADVDAGRVVGDDELKRHFEASSC